MRAEALLCASLLAVCACGDDAATPDAGVTTENCVYEPMSPTSGAGGTVAAGALMAGAAERVLDVPIGTALGGFTGRANSAGAAGKIDSRDRRISGGFVSSVGIESAPRAKALALSAGGETVVIVKLDAIFVYEGMLFDLEERLGADFHGKVILASSHSHSAWMQFTGQDALKAGGGEFRQRVFDGFVDSCVAAAEAALDAMEPAKLGIFVDSAFDLTDVINRDRRGENDELDGGTEGERHFVLIRVDTVGDEPIAVLPIFGEHGTLMDQDSPLASTDAPGGIERVLEEQLSGSPVVMHLNSAGGDTSPVGHGGVACEDEPGNPGDPCLPFAQIEGHGRAAAPTMLDAWTAAGAAMQTSLELEMITRSVPLMPDPETFTIRDGALSYAPFDLERLPDREIYDGNGELLSPIDEWNAPVGAALCETSEGALGPAAAIPGTEGLIAYGGCARLDVAADVIGALLDLDIAVDETHPMCQGTRTNVSALRIGDYVLGTLPGEMTTLIAKLVRANSPVDEDHTIVVGYAQGHVGYILRPEDWVLGGYEPSITFAGPLEGEYLAERLIELLPLATTADREDGTEAGADRVATKAVTDEFPVDDPAPMAGTVPSAIDPDVWSRKGAPAAAQPDAQIPRVSGIATFTFYGDDPVVKNPVVTLEYEATAGTYTTVTRRSGRPVTDGDFLITYTPIPLARDGAPQQQVYVVEWQAVPWLGAPGLDALGDRGGVPLGNYRFHVEGDGWTLNSAPFEVIAGGLQASATRAGTVLTANVRLHAPLGYRLLDLDLSSNRPVPVRSQDVTVELLDGGSSVIDTRTIATSADGAVSFDDADVATAVSVRIRDRFGNESTVTF